MVQHGPDIRPVAKQLDSVDARSDEPQMTSDEGWVDLHTRGPPGV